MEDLSVLGDPLYEGCEAASEGGDEDPVVGAVFPGQENVVAGGASAFEAGQRVSCVAYG